MLVDWPGLTFERAQRDGRPWADVVQIHDQDRAEAEIWTRLSGWIVSVPVDLGLRLAASGATVRRHAHCMTRPLAGAEVPEAWANPEVTQSVTGGSLVVTGLHHSAQSILSTWRSAYPAGHPDHVPADDEHLLSHELAPLLDGSMIGPVMECSGVVELEGKVVAACIVNDREGQAPLGGPWVGDVFRDPAPEFAGLGSLLLRRAIALASVAGIPALGLAVSEGNPARRLYERLGFELVDSSITVLMPGPHPDSGPPA